MRQFFNFGVRNFNNVFTGINLTNTGRAFAYTTAAATVGYNFLRSSNSRNQFYTAPGIYQPLAMTYDGRSNPTMGADGALTLALSKLR